MIGALNELKMAFPEAGWQESYMPEVLIGIVDSIPCCVWRVGNFWRVKMHFAPILGSHVDGVYPVEIVREYVKMAKRIYSNMPAAK